MSRPSFPYGRGDAAPRIVAAIAAWLDLPATVLHAPAMPARFAGPA